MDAITILLKCLKSKRYIDDVEKAKNEVSVERINLRKPDDLFIRDAITGIGTILKEDLDNHLTQAIIQRIDSAAEIAVYAHEGFIKQHLAEKTIEKLKKMLC